MEGKGVKADERRVVITGIGVITPLGLTGEELFENLLSGKCAIGPTPLSI